MRLNRLSLQPAVKGQLVPVKTRTYRCFYCVGGKQSGLRRESLSWVPLSNRIYKTSSSICQHTPLGDNRSTLKFQLCWNSCRITAQCQTISIRAGNQTPLKVHAKLGLSSGENGRLIIVGDVHGCVLELAQLLKKVRFNKNRDKLVFAGDLCNKGPRSQQALQLAMALDAIAVRGNHDDAALATYYNLQKRHASIKDSNPKSQWVVGMSQQEAAYLAAMPFTVRVPSLNIIITHAGLVPGVSIKRQRLQDLYRMRVLYPAKQAARDQKASDQSASNQTASATLQAADEGIGASDDNVEVSDDNVAESDPLDDGQGEPSLLDIGDQDDTSVSKEESTEGTGSIPWASQWAGPRHVFFGHDARRGLQTYDYATGLDTGCVYGRQLTACVIPLLPKGQKVNCVQHRTPTLAELRAEIVSVDARRKYN